MQTLGVKKVQHKSLTEELPKGDFVWRMRNDARKNKAKFSSNLEGPFRVREVAKGETYHLEWLLGKIVPRTWNATYLKFYYS